MAVNAAKANAHLLMITPVRGESAQRQYNSDPVNEEA